ncbi:hypothetical protein E6C50_05315 [Flavobacterium supellecticarium]|uniref:Uncharacterized protein n=1 Tax=Flavobacterium supellecticarium TaxID=2565924 RepID=A0A4S3ZZC6_9FLAO|nr:hypothetical protein [Flavobacterium supellecticarium]THF51192.1 hypothetical protein E6C50_05315 [Flavobacterium supellecticarium]
MEPNKLEEDFRDKLNSRTIQPSEMAWDRLDAMLSVSEKKKPKRSYKWLSMAAVFVGMLFVGTLLMEQQKEDLKIKETIKTVVKQQQDSITSEINTTPLATEEVVSEPVKKRMNNIVTVVKTNVKGATKVQSASDIGQQTTTAPETQIVEVAPPKEIKKITTTVDVESLLASVDKNAPTKSTIKKGNVKVDANSLLSTVEGEITTDYREGVFQTINRNFKTVKSAVANRNTE